MSCLVLSRLVLSRLVLSRLVLSRLVLSRLVLSRLVLSRLVLSRLVLSRLVLSRLVLSRLVLSRLVLSRLVLSCLVFSKRPKSTVTQGEAYGQPPYDQGEEGEGGRSQESPACKATEVDSHAGGGLRPTTLRSRRKRRWGGERCRGEGKEGREEDSVEKAIVPPLPICPPFFFNRDQFPPLFFETPAHFPPII